ncbi:MAG: hypothetical protein JSR45_07450 [Proteobacteria bacterium]|nr:hypothetical protein [Pseudomonadota bacterium]
MIRRSLVVLAAVGALAGCQTGSLEPPKDLRMPSTPAERAAVEAALAKAKQNCPGGDVSIKRGHQGSDPSDYSCNTGKKH